MKVFIVTQGSYSDYGIVKVCLTMERAKQFIEDDLKKEWNKYYKRDVQRHLDELKGKEKGEWDYEYNIRRSSFERFRQAMLSEDHQYIDPYGIEKYEVLE